MGAPAAELGLAEVLYCPPAVTYVSDSAPAHGRNLDAFLVSPNLAQDPRLSAAHSADDSASSAHLSDHTPLLVHMPQVWTPALFAAPTPAVSATPALPRLKYPIPPQALARARHSILASTGVRCDQLAAAMTQRLDDLLLIVGADRHPSNVLAHHAECLARAGDLDALAAPFAALLGDAYAAMTYMCPAVRPRPRADSGARRN